MDDLPDIVAVLIVPGVGGSMAPPNMGPPKAGDDGRLWCRVSLRGGCGGFSGDLRCACFRSLCAASLSLFGVLPSISPIDENRSGMVGLGVEGLGVARAGVVV